MGYGLILPDFPHKFYEPGRRRKRKLLKESRTRLHRCQLQLSKCCGEARKRIHFPNNKLKYKLQEYREKYTKKKRNYYTDETNENYDKRCLCMCVESSLP